MKQITHNDLIKWDIPHSTLDSLRSREWFGGINVLDLVNDSHIPIEHKVQILFRRELISKQLAHRFCLENINLVKHLLDLDFIPTLCRTIGGDVVEAAPLLREWIPLVEQKIETIKVVNSNMISDGLHGWPLVDTYIRYAKVDALNTLLSALNAMLSETRTCYMDVVIYCKAALANEARYYAVQKFIEDNPPKLTMISYVTEDWSNKAKLAGIEAETNTIVSLNKNLAIALRCLLNEEIKNEAK